MNQIKIGWAQTSITPSQPALMEGQMYQRCSRYVHDPITATALALDNGETRAIFVSNDMTEVPVHAFAALKAEVEKRGIDFSCVSINVTHSHNSTSFYRDFLHEDNLAVYDKDILPEFEGRAENMLEGDEGIAFYVEHIADLIEKAWTQRKPGGISYAHDYAAVAFSRRPQFGNNDHVETTMYGDCSRDDFVKFEGGIDTAVELLYTWNEDRELTGVVANVPCPSQVYELHCFLSADYWAPTRDEIREKLGKNVYVLPVVGAAGDLAPIDLVHISKTNKQALLDWGGQTKEVFRDFDMTLTCQGIADRISECVVRGFKYAKNYIDERPEFCHQVLSMELPIRQVSEEEYAEAKAFVDETNKKFSKENRMTMKDLVKAFEPQGVMIRYRQQKENPMFAFNCHILRLGNIAIATNPFELYHEFAQRIKARAKAEQVFVIQLSNGLGGYLPTKAAVDGGSYSSKAASTTCGPEGGDELVEKTLGIINSMWK